jgi:single-stranded-DNA-specific exonuclease
LRNAVRKWIEPPDAEVPRGLQEAVGGHPLVLETLVRRGFADVEKARAFLYPEEYQPASWTELPNLQAAVERLERAIESGEEICVWGDFDVDGQTATTILYSTLEELGARVRYHVPIRATESHGVNVPVLERLIGEGVELFLTCDTGVSAHEAVSYAVERGVDVVLTDHHDLPPTLPDANAVVNPKMLPQDHPLRELPGVGCAYKVAQALYQRAGREDEVSRYLDLVALGIVADVAVQRKDTRYLLQLGLEMLRQTTCPGLLALMEQAGVNQQWVTEEHIGYLLAPRLNALGRLADANVAVELLTTKSSSQARILAAEIEGLNARRRLLSEQVFEAAVEQVENDRSLLERGALVLSHPSWPPGVIGIVASRLVERYGLPTVLLAAPPGELARGSARSVEGCNITSAIAAHADLLESFGGHPMAAGLSMDPQLIPEFSRALSRTVREVTEGVEDLFTLPIAAYFELSELSLDLVAQLERLAPFGQGNPAPTLATRRLRLVGHSTVGRKGEHLQLVVRDERGLEARLIWWQGSSSSLPDGRFDLAYTVRASDFRGQRDVQIEWIDARVVERVAVAPPRERVAIQTVDLRAGPKPMEALREIRMERDVEIWAEAAARGEVGGSDRRELGPTRALVIWTAPPGRRELEQALDLASPEVIYLFAIDPGMDEPERFLERLAGLVKRAVSANEGWASLEMLAAATAQRESAVRLGLDWLIEKGHVSILDEEDGMVRLGAGSGSAGTDVKGATDRLRAVLAETSAYRAHFSRAPAEVLLGP